MQKALVKLKEEYQKKRESYVESAEQKNASRINRDIIILCNKENSVGNT
jgi:hypothetical protein